MPTHLSAALYFEGRAKRTRGQEERGRLLAVARKYRDLAANVESQLRRATPKGPAPAAGRRSR
jgi:hypothetical protein